MLLGGGQGEPSAQARAARPVLPVSPCVVSSRRSPVPRLCPTHVSLPPLQMFPLPVANGKGRPASLAGAQFGSSGRTGCLGAARLWEEMGGAEGPGRGRRGLSPGRG